ncbi:unnamed protein product [Camellia sinensis]
MARLGFLLWTVAPDPLEARARIPMMIATDTPEATRKAAAKTKRSFGLRLFVSGGFDVGSDCCFGSGSDPGSVFPSLP